MPERDKLEYVDNEQFAQQEVFEAFKRGVLQAPQVDIGGVLETATAAFGVAFNNSETVSLGTLGARLSPEQMENLRRVVAHAHAANGVHSATVGYEHMFPAGTRVMTDEQLEGVWIFCADKALALLENVIAVIGKLVDSKIQAERENALPKDFTVREKVEFWLSYPDVRDGVRKCLEAIRETVRSAEFKQLASAWKTKIRENPIGNAYRSSQDELLFSPAIDLFERQLERTGILNIAPKFDISARELVQHMLQQALT